MVDKCFQYLIIFKLFFPQEWIIILQLEHSQHNKKQVDTEWTFTTATSLQNYVRTYIMKKLIWQLVDLVKQD